MGFPGMGGPQVPPEDKPLSPLRQELQLSGKQGSGAGFRTLYDPANGKFFKLDPLTFRILTQWKAGTPAKVVEAVRLACGLEISVEDVLTVDRFFEQHYLTEPNAKTRERFEKFYRKKTNLKDKVLMQYLFFKIPLWRPEKLLTALQPVLRPLFSPWFWGVIAAGALVTLLLLLRQWDAFMHSMSDFFRLEGFLAYAVVILLSKAIHELGHAVALRHYGGRVPVMGVAILMFMPMLYTDASESWRIKNARDRLRVAAAGIAAEVMLATIASAGWLVLDDGPWRSACFVLATTNWVMTLLFNLNPLMRFDGYFILSDLLEMENLQPRAIAQLKKLSAKRLFSVDLPGVEKFPRRKARAMAAFGAATVMYRLTVIAGVIVLVYTFFFKLLGILLLIHQVWKSIGMPLKKGIEWMGKNREKIRPTPVFYTLAVLVIAVLAAIFMPVADRIYVQGASSAAEKTVAFTKSGGRVQSSLAPERTEVKAGEVILQLQSPEIDRDIELAQIRLKRLEASLATDGFDQRLKEQRLVTQEEIRRTRTSLAQSEKAKADLTLRAPFDAHIDWMLDGLLPGTWIGEDAAVAMLENTQTIKLLANVDELDRDRIRPGDKALFYAEDGHATPVKAVVTRVYDHEVQSLTDEIFDAKFGGEIMTEGENRSPVRTYYRVELEVPEVPEGFAVQQRTGTILIKAEPRSLFMRFVRKVQGILIRESVF